MRRGSDMRLMQRTRRVGIAIALGTLLVSSQAHAELVDRIVARVAEHIVTQSDLARLLPVFVQLEGIDPRRLQTPSGRNAVANEALDRIVDSYLFEDFARGAGLVVTDSEVEQHMAGQRSRMRMTEGQFVEALRQQNIELEDFKEYLHMQLLRIRVLQQEVLGRVNVSDEQVEQAMRDRFPEGFFETWMTTSHIFVRLAPDAPAPEFEAAMRAIEAIRARLAAGEAFEAIAREVNVDASARADGRVGRFRLGELDPTYEAAALALEPRQVTEPVRTQFGIHLIRLEATEKQPLDNVDEARERLRMTLRNEQIDREEKTFAEDLRRKSFVEVRDRNLAD